jgi:hypothetical protein
MSAQAAVGVPIYGLPVGAPASWQPNSPFVILADDARSAISARWLRISPLEGSLGATGIEKGQLKNGSQNAKPT